MNKQLIISIGREYGSGGHEIGERLAKKLDLPFYDKNLLNEVANIKNVNADNLYKYDEAPHKLYFSRTVRGYNNSPEVNIAEMQFALLGSKAADEDSFVIVGRCSDEIFKGVAPFVSIFITGNYEDKVSRIMTIKKMNRRQAERTMENQDRLRRNYHNHFCKTRWQDASTYNLCVNSSVLGIDGTVDFLYEYIKRVQESK